MRPPFPEPRLTSLAHGGGCGCKIAPAALREILNGAPAARAYTDLLVGAQTSDDAAVWRLNPRQAIVATTDFFTPIVDDPDLFGRIAATNALSDVYAMGGTPLFALAIVGMPVDTLSSATIRMILEGGRSVCEAAGAPVVGGHSIDAAEPIYGLAVIGLVDPEKVLTNAGARVGDRLILTKPLGVGVFSAALKQERLSEAAYATMAASATQLNAVGADLSQIPGVHALTDVTGFGLLGHACEMARGSGVDILLHSDQVPFWPGALELAEAGVRTGASRRNLESVRAALRLPPSLSAARLDLLCDPQTSGGLLISVSEASTPAVMQAVRAAGFARAAIVGEVAAGDGAVVLEPSASAAVSS